MNKHSPKSVNTVASCFLKMGFLNLVLFILFVYSKLTEKVRNVIRILKTMVKAPVALQTQRHFFPILSL